MDEHFWLVCHTRPRCEKKFAALMAAEEFEHYLALIQSVRKYQNQTKRFTKPLFPGYVFAQVPAERKTRIYQQDLLVRAITVEDVPKFLRQLEDVKAIVASGNSAPRYVAENRNSSAACRSGSACRSRRRRDCRPTGRMHCAALSWRWRTTASSAAAHGSRASSRPSRAWA